MYLSGLPFIKITPKIIEEALLDLVSNFHELVSDDRIKITEEKIKLIIMDIYSVHVDSFKNNNKFQQMASQGDKFFQIMLVENDTERLHETFEGYLTLLDGNTNHSKMFFNWLDKVFNVNKKANGKARFEDLTTNWMNLELDIQKRLYRLMKDNFANILDLDQKVAINLWKNFEQKLKIATVKTIDEKPNIQLQLLEKLE